MSHVRFRLSLAQINTTVGDLEGNRLRILGSLRRAKSDSSDLLIFPEMTLTGYSPEDLLLREDFVAANLAALRSLAPHARGISAVVGFVDRDDAGLYNAAAYLCNGRVAAVYRKAHLPNYGVFDEKRYFRPGTGPVCVDQGGIRIGLTICEDIWEKKGFVYAPGYGRGLSLLVNLSASPYHFGKQSQRDELVLRLAKRLGVPVAYANLVGGQDELVYDGTGLIADGAGRAVACLRSFEEDFVTVDLALRVFAPGVPGRRTRVPGLPKRPGIRPAPPPPARTPTQPEEEIYRALVLGTRDYVEKNGFAKTLVGMSGGIDSALVACIAVDALGPRRVEAVTMPSPHTSAGTLRDARLVCERLGIDCRSIPIRSAMRVFDKLLAEIFGKRKPDKTEENLQARIRGTLLMAVSNKLGHLVLATGNKSEMATGYCTLYGDMAGGFAVIKDVPKTWVYRLAAWRNSLPGRPSPIPASVIRRAPSAELRPGQTDQDSLPPYSMLDRFLEAYVEREAGIARIVREGLPLRMVRSAARLVDASEYKRRQAPPGIKITPRAFGRDRRMPITRRGWPWKGTA